MRNPALFTFYTMITMLTRPLLHFLYGAQKPEKGRQLPFCTNNKDASPGKVDFDSDSATFRRINVHALSLVMLFLLCAAILLNWSEGRTGLLLPLALFCVPPVVALIWMRFAETDTTGPAWLICGSLAMLGVLLLLGPGGGEPEKLYWYIIYPPMVLFGLGLRSGTLLFSVFYIFLVIILLTPLNQLMDVPPVHGNSIRFLLACLGTFIFSWCTERARHNTRLALTRSLAHLERDALTDHLTGLGNRRDFQTSLDWMLGYSERSGSPFALAFIDIDHFKRINDLYGHDVGDKVLRHTAKELKGRKRSSDRLFRWGGEEFALLMPDSDLKDARAASERMRRHIEVTPFESDDLLVCYTISIGLHCGKAGGEAFEKNKPLREADRNLYEAKMSGRNKVVG